MEACIILNILKSNCLYKKIKKFIFLCLFKNLFNSRILNSKIRDESKLKVKEKQCVCDDFSNDLDNTLRVESIAFLFNKSVWLETDFSIILERRLH